MSYEVLPPGDGRHRKPRPPEPPWTPPDWTCVCGEHPDVDDGGPTIPPCLPPLPPLAPLVLPDPAEYQPARHRVPRVEDPAPEGTVSLYEARWRREYREYMREALGVHTPGAHLP